MELELISLDEARKKGLKHYFTGKPCKNGHISKRSTGNRNCLECARLKAKPYDPIIGKRFYEKHKERLLNNKRSYKAKWYQKNKNRLLPKILKQSEAWRKLNPDLHAARQAKRRASKLMATPSWLTTDDHKKIAIEYELAKWCTDVTGIKYDVDHIVPLKGKTVCGLHVPWNLRVITKSENCAKGNRL